MYFRPVIALVVVSLFGYVLTIPLTPPEIQQQLMKEMAEFLRENKEVASALKNVDMDRLATRSRRDAIDDPTMDVEEMDTGPKQKDVGFFDRAAKFMMEVLQRFLKWINSDN